MKHFRAITPIVLFATLAGAYACAPDPTADSAGVLDPTVDAEVAPEWLAHLMPPTVAGSAEPDLFATEDGLVHMSWLEPVQGDGGAAASTRRGHFALRFATLDGDSWSAPRTIADGEDYFVNWADFPSIVATGDTLVAHWLVLNGGRGTAYDVHISRSTDGGDTWSESVVPHSDGTPTEHGFVSLVPEPDGGFTAVWLDGRGFARAEPDGGGPAPPEGTTGAAGVDPSNGPAMTLRAARFDGHGTQQSEVLLDERICDCCQTSAAYVGDTLVAVYRDRSPTEVRDIWSVRRTPAGWQAPVPVARDGWQIPGCPVNGPAIAASGDLAAVAWFSMVDGNPEVKVAFTGDAGASFAAPILVDSGDADSIDSSSARAVARLADASGPAAPVPLGRVDVAWVGDQKAAVSWIVARGAQADLILQTVGTDGVLGERHVIATTGSGPASGFPRLVRSGERLVLAWTETEDDVSIVRTAAIALPLH